MKSFLTPARMRVAFAMFLGAQLAGHALADEADIRKAFATCMPEMPKIDEISRTPVPGLRRFL